MQNGSSQPAQDVVLRSSDGTLFYSWKTVLSISSPVFSDMFALSQEGADQTSEEDIEPHLVDDDGRLIIDLPEDKHTIEHLLSLCHPPSCSGKRFQIETLQELRGVLEAATNYDMDNLRLVALEELTNPTFLRADPVHVYALACLCGRREAAQLAARHTLALPTFLARGYNPDFEKVHAGLFCRLALYREECVMVVSGLTEDHTWIVYTEDISPLFGCDDYVEWTTVKHPPSRKYPTGREENMLVHKWWMDYMKKSACALQRSPHGNTVKDPTLVAKTLADISSSKCRHCSAPQVREAFRSFLNKFAKKVGEMVADVEVNVGF